MHEFSDVVRRQNRANQIRLRRGVNLIQMTLRFGLHHKLPDAPVEGVFEDYVGTRASDVFRPTGHLGKVPISEVPDATLRRRQELFSR
jgi:hypothetical protein